MLIYNRVQHRLSLYSNRLARSPYWSSQINDLKNFEFIPFLIMLGFYLHPIYTCTLLTTGSVVYALLNYHRFVDHVSNHWFINILSKYIFNNPREIKKNIRKLFIEKILTKEFLNESLIPFISKNLIPILIWFYAPQLTSLSGIYGFYSFGGEACLNYANNFLSKLNLLINRTIEKLLPTHRNSTRLVLGSVISITMLYTLFNIGFVNFASYCITKILSTLFLLSPFIGLAAFFKDLKYLVTNPFHTFSNYGGGLIGGYYGYHFTFRLMTSTFEGHFVEKIKGSVTSNTLISALGASFFGLADAPINSLFTWTPGADLMNFLKEANTPNMLTTATFMGVASPTNFNLIYYTLVGASIGLAVHTGIKYLYQQFKKDLTNEAHNQWERRNLVQSLYTHRWSVTFLSSLMLITFASPLTPFVLSSLGGSQFLALTSNFAILYIGKRLYSKLVKFNNNDPTLNAHRLLEELAMRNPERANAEAPLGDLDEENDIVIPQNQNILFSQPRMRPVPEAPEGPQAPENNDRHRLNI